MLASSGAQAAGVSGSANLLAAQLVVDDAHLEQGRTSASQAKLSPGSLTASGTAEFVLVNWTQQERTAVASPATPEGIAGVTDGPRSSGEARHEQVLLEFQVSQDDASLGWTGATWTARADAPGPVTMRPSGDETWTVGRLADARAAPGPSAFHANISVAAGQVILLAQDAAIVLGGDGRLYLWGINLTVTDSEGRRHHYPSGEWVDEDTGPGGATRTIHTQFIRVELQSAPIELAFRDADVQWAMPGAILSAGHVSATQATGSLSSSSERILLQGQTLDVRGAITLRAFASGGQPPLASELEFEGFATANGEELFGLEPNLVTRLQPLAPPLAAGVGVLVAVGIAWLAFDRARRPRDLWLTAAEAALAGHRPLTARRRARGLLHALPDDADAWFVYATGLLQSNEHDRLVREVEPVARRLAAERTRGLAFVLALAHARLAAPELARPWLALACEDPALRQRASVEPALERVLDLSAAS